MAPRPNHNPFSRLVPQDYDAMNRGDMYVPAGSVKPPMQNAMAATPYIGRLMNVHSVPVTYTLATATVRPHNKIGMITPEGSA